MFSKQNKNILAMNIENNFLKKFSDWISVYDILTTDKSEFHSSCHSSILNEFMPTKKRLLYDQYIYSLLNNPLS